ncbi:MAG TPA: restriction endonuclease subunit S [Pontiellaceae bacterium]|nr:restriction endonuclease subunit S [Pontiellaceae bacterium]
MSEPWEIPASWQWSTMGDVAAVVGGGTPKSDQAEYFGGNIPWITPADLSGYTEKFISAGARSITKAGLDNSGARVMPAGAVLFSSRAPIGYVAIASNPVSTNQGFKSFVLQDGLTSDFVYYYLHHAKKLAVEMASGTTFLEISGKKAAQLPIPVAPLDEQRRIVAEIEKQFTRLEAGVSALKRVQANLKRYRAAVLKAACEGRLVPTEKWPITTIRDVTLIVTKGSSPNWQGFEYCDDGVVFVRSQNVCWGKLDLSEVAHLPAGFNEKEKKSVLKVGDVLLNIVGASIGRAAIATSDVAGGNVNQAVAVIRCQQEKILPQFLMIYLLSPATQTLIHSQAVDVARANFSLGDISKMPVPIPSLAEQTRIVEEVERRLSVVEELEAVVSANLQRATRLRQSILQKAFLGELV